MSKKNHVPGPVPAGNKPKRGPGAAPIKPNDDPEEAQVDAGFNEADPKHRSGDFGGAGEHPRQEYSQNRD